MTDATIDYTGGPFSPSFKVIIPDKSSCGCGESFVL
jgi:Fe-S cluster assembly iron-binding protein IscA